MVPFNRNDGFFELYEDVEPEVIGLLSCGDCPGATIVTRLAQLNLWN
jgi:predicted metal-binding protein